MSDEKRRPGRPATGETPARKVRVEDDLWNETERLAGELAALNGAKRNVTAYVKEALRRENQRVERIIVRLRADAERAAAAASAPVTAELTADQAWLLQRVRGGSVRHTNQGTRQIFDDTGRPQDLTQGQAAILDKLLDADMASPAPHDPESGVLKIAALGLVLTSYSLTGKGRDSLIAWEQAQQET